MGRGYQGAVLNLLRAPEFDLTVIGVEQAGDYTHLRISCPELLGPDRTRELPPTIWVRLWIPEDGTEYQRAYTLVDIDEAAGACSIHLLHHQPDGPASRWALAATPGDTVPAQLYGGTKYRAPEPGAHLLLVGDPASAPAIADALAAAPPSCTADVVLVCGEDTRLPGFPPLPGAQSRVVRVDPAAGTQRVVEVVGELAADVRPDWAWVALESASIRAVRRAFLDAGIARADIQHQAYWVQGRAMGAESR